MNFNYFKIISWELLVAGGALGGELCIIDADDRDVYGQGASENCVLNILYSTIL